VLEVLRVGRLDRPLRRRALNLASAAGDDVEQGPRIDAEQQPGHDDEDGAQAPDCEPAAPGRSSTFSLSRPRCQSMVAPLLTNDLPAAATRLARGFLGF
jgi:hypothetical protein